MATPTPEMLKALSASIVENLSREMVYSTNMSEPKPSKPITADTVKQWSRLLSESRADAFPAAPFGGLKITVVDKQKQARTPFVTVNVTKPVKTRAQGRKISRKQAKRQRGFQSVRNYKEPTDLLKTPYGYIATQLQYIRLRNQIGAPTP